MKEQRIITEEQMIAALRANGWRTVWTDNDWVKPDCSDPDHAGRSLQEAFRTLLKEKNIL